MITDLTDTLDAALEQLRAGDPISSILTDHPAQAEALAPLLNAATALEAIRPVEMPPSEAVVADRNEFLVEITRLQRQAVSPAPPLRLKEWIAHQIPWLTAGLMLQRKEQRRMSTILVKATLIISLVFGSAGGAVALAANSLPDSPLYPAKLAMEQARLNATEAPADQAALHLALARVRAQEMERLALAGEVPDEGTSLRLQEHLDHAFRLGAQLPDEELLSLLNQAQQMLQAREREMLQAQTQVAGPAEEPLRQATRVLNQARQEVENGLQDPQAFRWQQQHQQQPGPEEPCDGDECPCPDCEPEAHQNQHQDQYQQQPGPEEPCDGDECPCPDCEPEAHQNQHQDQYQQQPGPEEPCGDAECPCTDCDEPAGDQNQSDDNSQPDEQPDSEKPGDDSDDTGNDSEPVDDQSQDGGSQPEQPSGDADQDGGQGNGGNKEGGGK